MRAADRFQPPSPVWRGCFIVPQSLQRAGGIETVTKRVMETLGTFEPLRLARNGPLSVRSFELAPVAERWENLREEVAVPA